LPTALTVSPQDSRLGAGDSGPTVTLTAGGAPLPEKTVLLELTRADGSVAAQVARITDGQGRVGLAGAAVPAGKFTLKAYSGGTIGAVALGDPTPYTTATASGTITIYASVSVTTTVGGIVPATLALTLGPPALFGNFTPGVDKEYTATTSANVISSAG